MNTTMKFTVTGQRIELTEPVMLVAGTMNIYTASFVFNSTWDGYTKTAVFRSGDVEREQLLTDNACSVPWEVLVAGKDLRVGVYGTKDDIRLPTIWTTRTLYVYSGAGPTEEAAEPSPALVEQLLTKVGNLDTLKTEDKSSLVAAINEIWASGGGGSGASVTDAAINEDGHLIITLSTGKQIDAGYAVGPAGSDGQDGANGKSAYQYAKDGGYTGTEAEFAAKMAAEIPAVDTTLTESGKAADAAAVGARLSSLSEEIVTTAESKVSAHNTGTDTHSDIRLLISGLTDRLNALADSDDTTLDQLSEIVAYIKSNRTLIEAITTSKVSVADIVDNLTTNVANKPLSAAQGVALKALIDAITVPDKLPNPNALTFTGAVEGSYDGSKPLTVDIPSGGGGGCSNIIFDSGEISEEVNMIGPIDISGYSKIRIFGKAYPSANSAGKRAAQLYFGDNSHRLLCNAGINKLFDTRGNPVSFLIYLDVGANAISTFSFSGFNASNTFNDSEICVSSQAASSDGSCLIYSTSFDLANMYITAQDDLVNRPWGSGTRIMVIGDA